jgi:esterase/lipase superfamily enzyme
MSADLQLPRRRLTASLPVRLLVIGGTLLLGGCSLNVRMMPTPTVLAELDRAADAAGRVAPESGKGTLEVLYATNRRPAGPPDARYYSRVRTDELRLGVATLQVGDGTKPWDELQAASTHVDERERPKISLVATRELAVLAPGSPAPGEDTRAFFAQLDELLARTGKRDLLIYMHGARTDFARAAAQAAQFQHYVGTDAVVMVFAWPSAGTLLRYGRDVATARRSVPTFARLLEHLSQHTQVGHIDVLAYSAGAMIASPGLARAVGDATAAGEPARLRLGEIYYAAPDIDFPVFVDNLPRYEDHVRRVTVAVNLGDRALSFAQWRHRVSRAGRPNLAELGPDETRWLVETSARVDMDVLSIRPEDLPGLPAGSHSFWYDHPWVSSDILLKLRFRAPPAGRGLRPDTNEISVAFWRFPTDYAERLPDVVRALQAQGTPQ